MKPVIAVLAMLTVLVIGAAATTARAQSAYEKDPVLKAKDLVAPELLKGPNFTVDDRVPVKDFLARFTLRSDLRHLRRPRHPHAPDPGEGGLWPGPARTA